MRKSERRAQVDEAWKDWDSEFADWVQFVVGLVLLAWGAYFLGPWETSHLTQQYSLSLIVGPVAAFIEVLIGAGCMIGALLHNKTISNIALTGTVISYVAITVLRIATSGLFPFFWLFQLGLALIAGLLMIRAGLKDGS